MAPFAPRRRVRRSVSSFRRLSRSRRMASSFSSFFVFLPRQVALLSRFTENELLTMWPLFYSGKGWKPFFPGPLSLSVQAVVVVHVVEVVVVSVSVALQHIRAIWSGWTKIAAVTRSLTYDYLSRAMIAVNHFGIFCPRHFAISLTEKEAALGSNFTFQRFQRWSCRHQKLLCSRI